MSLASLQHAALLDAAAATSADRSIPAPGAAFERTKRVIDVVVAVLGLLAVAPLILACMAWIKWCDGGPVLYHQWRVGRAGYLFRIRKLRTMSLDAEASGAQFATAGDPRVLPGCGWMRRSHVDELPQLLNILTGDMSLVGPRPERPELMETLRQALPNIESRLAGAPGLTGLAQVRNGYTNDARGARRKLAYDLLYLRRRSVLGDLRLMLQTVPKVWDRRAC
jgi:lipopolysaccharide/colanic/teichoic acid biosynthesis glycosyltransferase